MFFDLSDQNDTLVNYAVDPVIREYDRMIYLALSEFFFDSGMFAYYRAGVFQMHIVNEKVTTTTDYQKSLQTSNTPTDLQNHHRQLKTTTDLQNHHRS